MSTIEEKKDILKQRMSNASDKLSELAGNLNKDCASIISTDSFGKDEQTLYKLLMSISNKFELLEKELDTPFKIAVVGSQGTGKSTLVNLLLGDALMPSTLDENESAIIRLAYPEDESLEEKAVFVLDNKLTKIMSIKDANNIIDKEKRNPEDNEFVKSITYVTFYKKLQQLKEIEIINTPGMNVITEDFYAKVKHLFVEADIIIWVNSAEKILGDFGNWLINKIYSDNKKIIGMITFPDKLYAMDNERGVTDVVDQFMDELEKNMLIRVNDQVALFIFNGRFAQISESHNKTAKFIIDTDDLSENESSLRILYNYLHHGFGYSDNTENVKILQNHNLFGMNDMLNNHDYESKFILNDFYNYCVEKKFCKVDENLKHANYTDLGRKLIGEASQFAPFKRFNEEQLITTSLGEKYNSVKNRIDTILSTTDGKDTSKSRLIQIKGLFEDKRTELDEVEQQRSESFKNLLNNLDADYNEWYIDQLGLKAVKYTDVLLDSIFEKFEREISRYDFLKEIAFTLYSKVFKTGKDSPVSEKISLLISESVEEIFPKKINNLLNEAINKIELILIQMNKNFFTEKNLFDKKIELQDLNIKNNVDLSRIMESIAKMLKNFKGPLGKEILNKFVKKDLRKGKNNFFKKNIIKPLVKSIRSLLKKLGVKFVEKKAKNAAKKSVLGPWGWLLIVWDVISTAKDLDDMYNELKNDLKEQIKNEPSFNNSFKIEAKNTYDEIYDSVKIQLTNDFTEGKQDLSYVLEGILVCENAIEELDNIKNDL